MDKRHKIDVAVFRSGVIQDFVTGINPDYGEKEKLIREKCARKWYIPFSQKTSISKGTIKRWIQIYEKSDCKLESLYPKTGMTRGSSGFLMRRPALPLNG